MKIYIEKIKAKENLSPEEIATVMKTVMDGCASQGDIEEFLLALREKGPTVEEITGAAQIMRRFVLPVHADQKIILDTCGTGGDKKGTFNISTVVALVVAGAGVTVAKHGNRSVSSKCGSADVLEALGVKIQLTPDELSRCLKRVGIAFLFAQGLHPAMKHVAPARKALGVETIFNVLGPLTNPAGATHQMMGVYHRELIEPMAHVLKNLGLKRALVVHGSDGLDEVTTTGITFVGEFNGHEIRLYSIDPAELGIKKSSHQDLLGGDLTHNADIVTEILDGSPGPKRDIVVLNAACALYIAQAVPSIADGLALALHTIDAGKAREKLQLLKECTNSFSH